MCWMFSKPFVTYKKLKPFLYSLNSAFGQISELSVNRFSSTHLISESLSPPSSHLTQPANLSFQGVSTHRFNQHIQSHTYTSSTTSYTLAVSYFPNFGFSPSPCHILHLSFLKTTNFAPHPTRRISHLNGVRLIDCTNGGNTGTTRLDS